MSNAAATSAALTKPISPSLLCAGTSPRRAGEESTESNSSKRSGRMSSVSESTRSGKLSDELSSEARSAEPGASRARLCAPPRKRRER